MEYLLAWRMALAGRLLREGSLSMEAIAQSVGYGSTSSFSTAFTRTMGEPPGRYARRRSTGDDGPGPSDGKRADDRLDAQPAM